MLNTAVLHAATLNAAARCCCTLQHCDAAHAAPLNAACGMLQRWSAACCNAERCMRQAARCNAAVPQAVALQRCNDTGCKCYCIAGTLHPGTVQRCNDATLHRSAAHAATLPGCHAAHCNTAHCTLQRCHAATLHTAVLQHGTLQCCTLRAAALHAHAATLQRCSAALINRPINLIAISL